MENLLFITIAASLLSYGCNDAHDDKFDYSGDNSAIINKAVLNSKYPREFASLFPDASHEIIVIRYQTPTPRPNVPGWSSTVHLYDRYTLVMSFAVEIDDRKEITPLESPTFFFIEVVGVKFDKNGKTQFNMGEYRELTESKWKQLVESAGGFSVLGINMKKDSPVENFEQWKNQP